MWCVLFELEDLPFSASSIVLLLSWYIVIVGMGYPCAAKKCLVHSTCPIQSSMVTSSASAEFLVFSFFLHEAVYIAPFPSVMYIPVWHFMSGCTAYKMSTHHFGSLPGSIVRGQIFCVPIVLHYLCEFFCSRRCLILLPWYIGKLLPFVCLVLFVCLSTVVWLLGDGTTAPHHCLVSCILGLCWIGS